MGCRQGKDYPQTRLVSAPLPAAAVTYLSDVMMGMFVSMSATAKVLC